MIVTPIQPLRGERVLATSPPLARDVTSTWRRRLRMFTGRSLSGLALALEQVSRAGRLALHGQLFSPGIVEGLNVGLSPDRRSIEIAPGLGVVAGGEVISVPAHTTVAIANIRDIAAGVGVLVLKPTEHKIIGAFEAEDSCDYDPAKDGYADWQLIDGAVLAFVPWPAGLLGPIPAGPQARNQMAYAIFGQEAGLSPTETLPWEDAGLPIGLVSIQADFTAEFLERGAVVRTGGARNRRTPILENAGHAALWQARVMQFTEQLAGFDFNRLSLVDCSAEFAFLPPAGLLPEDAFTLAFSHRFGAILRNRFFPPYFELSVAPIPLEQLDAAIERAAPLAPIETAAAQSIEILIPVPQAFFEPDLLMAEQADPRFEQELNAAILRRAEWLRRRENVRAGHSGIYKEITGTGYPFPATDPNKLEANEFMLAAVPVDPLDTPDDRAQMLADHDAAIVAPLARALGSEVSAQSFATKIRAAGLEKAAAQLQALVDKGDDVINLGFLKAQTDMYRLRQLLLGGTAASRLATSPALAGIVEARTAVAQEAAIQAAYTEMRANKMEARAIRSVKAVDLQTVFLTAQADSDLGIVTAEGAAEPQFFTAAGLLSAGAFSVGATLKTSRQLGSVATELVTDRSKVAELTTGVSPGQVPKQPPPKPEEVITPVVTGRQELRTTTTEQRIRAAKGPEARDFALASKFDILLNLRKAPSTLDEKLYPMAGPMLKEAFDSISVPHVADFQNGQFVFVENRNVKRIVRKFSDLDDAAIARTLQEPDDKDIIDESSFFSAATDIIESVIAVLRAAEGRIDAFREALAVCQSTIEKFRGALGRFDERLATIEDKLTESRQDVSIIRLLFADEQRRVQTINQRRERVIREQAKFYAFHRPPTVSLLAPMPARTVNPELLQAPVPVCLSRALEPPAEIRKLVELLRESPVRWFPRIEALLDRFDRVAPMVDVLRRARTTVAALGSISLERAPVAEVSNGRFGAAIQNVLTAQRTTALQYRYTLASVDVDVFTGRSWKESRDAAGKLLTIGDLIDHSTGRQDVSRESAKELDQIGRVAACLHTQFAEIEPAIRLDWALRFSQYDGSIDLRSLASLPHWGEIDYLDRQEMQSFVDWLFGQVDNGDAEALESIQNIIRVAMLLASHAPVDRILQGEIQEAANLQEGGVVSAKFNPAIVSKLRRGLEFELVRGTQVVGRAVVDDLLGELASLKLTKNFVGGAVLAVDSGVKLVAATATAKVERRIATGSTQRSVAAAAAITLLR
jgi:hypothetical protein